jgi:hypothetical protein
MDRVLRRHASSLECLFTAMSQSGGSGEKGRHLSLAEWKGMLRGARLIDVDVTDRDASMCFAWSRMCVVDETSERGRMQEMHLPFEGFLEALVRLANLKALPTDDEIESRGAVDADDFMSAVRGEEEEGVHAWLVARKTPWGGEQTQQPMWRAVAHLLNILIRTIERDGGPTASQNMDVTIQEAKYWVKHTVSGSTSK